jgi:SNF2 family DNA or RNA helicase
VGTEFNVPIFKTPLDNTRIQALINAIDETNTGVIIWSRFTRCLLDIEAALKEVYPNDESVLYYGDVKQAQRHENVNRFQKGDARFFLGQQHSGGIGLTLTAAGWMAYYANDFSLEKRLQSEDRPHRIGQTKTVNIDDIEAVETMDGHIIDSLRASKDVADIITGDPKLEWI